MNEFWDHLWIFLGIAFAISLWVYGVYSEVTHGREKAETERVQRIKQEDHGFSAAMA